MCFGHHIWQQFRDDMVLCHSDMWFEECLGYTMILSLEVTTNVLLFSEANLDFFLGSTNRCHFVLFGTFSEISSWGQDCGVSSRGMPSEFVKKLAIACVYMVVSKNGGTPKSSILIGFSIINHPFWGTPIFGNTHIHLRNKWNAFNDIILVYLSQVFLPKCANQESCFASFLRCDFWQTPLSVRNSKKFKHSWKRLHISRARICCTGKIIHWRRIWRFVLFVSP